MLPRGLAALTLLALVACGDTRQPPRAEPQSTERAALQVSADEEPTWQPTGNLQQGRLLYTATPLKDGRVLVVGGFNRTAEVYDPASKTWSRTGDALIAHRYHTATRLEDGRVLVAGGEESGHTAEVYSPASEQWSAVGNLGVPRGRHAAVLLPSGRVLALGGRDSAGGVLASVEAYDPA
ncbi:kelch repeat-containing protein, partial [Archangium sp.]|uniref:Kelch repeat-containing protein n=1 Tax=Archangium sp. TaxID=1872627 RepID=UPI002EDA9553